MDCAALLLMLVLGDPSAGVVPPNSTEVVTPPSAAAGRSISSGQTDRGTWNSDQQWKGTQGPLSRDSAESLGPLGQTAPPFGGPTPAQAAAPAVEGMPGVAPLGVGLDQDGQRPERPLGQRPEATNASILSPASGSAVDFVARALESPQGTRLAGDPQSLLAALAVVRDAPGKLAVVHAYWDAVGMVAQYNLRWRERANLDRLEPRPGDELMLGTARASAGAAVVEAQIAAVSAQHALAQQSFLPTTSASLPLPSDRPCASAYETRYEQLFASRPATARAWLIDRTLPLRRQAIDERARAVAAAEQALAASQQAYARGSVDLENVLAALAAWSQQEDALMRNVCDYNHDIADYAVAVLVGPTDNATLVSMLIGPQREPVAEPVAGPGGMVPIGRTLPVVSSPWNPPAPTLAPRQSAVRPAGALEPKSEAGQRPSASAGPEQPRPTVDAAPDLFPLDGQMVPIVPSVRPAPTDEKTPTQPANDEAEAPKVRVIPAEPALGGTP